MTAGFEGVGGQTPPPRPPAFEGLKCGVAEEAGAAGVMGVAVVARSACEPHRVWIEEQVRLKRNGQAIYQDLVDCYGFGSSYESVKRFVRGYGAATRTSLTGLSSTLGRRPRLTMARGR